MSALAIAFSQMSPGVQIALVVAVVAAIIAVSYTMYKPLSVTADAVGTVVETGTAVVAESMGIANDAAQRVVQATGDVVNFAGDAVGVIGDTASNVIGAIGDAASKKCNPGFSKVGLDCLADCSPNNVFATFSCGRDRKNCPPNTKKAGAICQRIAQRNT